MERDFNILATELKDLGFNVTAKETGLYSTFGEHGCLIRAGLDSIAGDIAYEAVKRSAKNGNSVALCLTLKGNKGAENLLNKDYSVKYLYNVDIISKSDGGPVCCASANAKYAATARISIVLHGFTAHGAQPQVGINAVDAGALAMNAINAIKVPYYVNHLVQIISMDAGGSSINMIPSRVTMLVSIAAMNDNWLSILIDKIKTAIECSAKSIDASAEFKDLPGQRAVDETNNSAVNVLKSSISKTFGCVAPTVTSAKESDQQKIAEILNCPSACLVLNSSDDMTKGINTLIEACAFKSI